jgi:hypothetical protein
MKHSIAEITAICLILGFSSGCVRSEKQPSTTTPADTTDTVSRLRAMQEDTRDNMRSWQVAVEMYAKDSGGTYPKSVRDCASYFPGGACKLGAPSAPECTTNAITGVKNELPFDAGIRDTAQINKMRKMPPQITRGKPGQVGYSVLNDGLSYAIIGTDRNGNAIEDSKTGLTLVLSHN